MNDTTERGDVVLVTCGAVSPALLEKGGPRFSCSKKKGHGGDHAVPLEWPVDPALFDEYPWTDE